MFNKLQAIILLCIIAAYASLKACGTHYTAEPLVNIFSTIKWNKMERTKLKGVSFSSPSFGAGPLGRAMLPLDVHMACRSPLYIALSCVIDILVLLLLSWAPLVQNLGTRINWLIPGLPPFLSIKSLCHVHFYFWLCLEMLNSDKTGHLVTWILPPFIKWEFLCLFHLEANTRWCWPSTQGGTWAPCLPMV